MFYRLALLPLMPLALDAADLTEATRRLDDSAAVFQEVMQISDRAIPQALLDRAECTVIIPSLKKGAFILGGKYGRGFASCRGKGGAGWGPPAGIRVEGGSFGFQIGGSETDIVMLIMNERGSRRLMKSKFTLGGNASIAAGPAGRDANVETDAMLTAEILTWSRSRGIFAGISLQGATLRPDLEVNRELYGQRWSTKEIIGSGLAVPTHAKPLVQLLNKYSSRKSR